MLKLTLHDGGIVYVAAKYIVAMQGHDYGVTDVWTSNGSHLVKETPEQIMAMPEMIYAMYPAMFTAPVNPGPAAPQRS